MAKKQNYRIKCGSNSCGYEGLRRYDVEHFDELCARGNMYCPKCGNKHIAIQKSSMDIKDSFKPGWQGSINMYCETKKQYEDELKKRGLVILGYEDLPEPQDDGKVTYWTDKNLKMAYDKGFKISGREAEMLKQGYEAE